METPVACSLSRDQARDRLEQWRAVSARAIRSARVEETRLDIHLGLDAVRIGEAAVLAASEKACCPFFSFRMEIEAEGVVLIVEAPSGASELLDAFAASPRE